MRHVLLLLMLCGYSATAWAYPLDGADMTGISRLEGYRLAQQGRVAGNLLSPGAQLATAQVVLNAGGASEALLSMPDPYLGRKLVDLLGADARGYGISLLDLSDPAHPRYAEYQGGQLRNPGSVGKLVVALALFQALADLYPDDTAARERVLRSTMVVADALIRSDHHKVPFWLPEQMRLQKRRLAEGDEANLWSYLDWMLSASSNAAASMVIEQVMLLRRFGRSYPVSRSLQQAYFSQTPKKELSRDLLAALQQPVADNGLDPGQLRQGGFFSHEGKRRVPGTGSICSARELMHYMLLLEQGRLVDRWSSLQLKRLLYMTERRIRYAAAPALADAAVYFKSGSFYKCRDEAGFVCKKYQGNALNLMNSVAIIEYPAGAPRLHYLVAITSNVLKKNSAIDHRELATRIHGLLQSLHGVTR
ncbi:hypothetical protein FEF65_01740 [Mariprofundus erugo]|uniref:Beta-lactamase class A catalytic domain-containing protein n=1 Tax=Mariprofundus erugo TaxID=2528639 RepID=A0A5R9GX24_9PROT|nr:serine hydrolase [Mariprofundus erugo]TLS69229.1 hypothetical protein FEF65_01740 [Mariprofundus erugo]